MENINFIQLSGILAALFGFCIFIKSIQLLVRVLLSIGLFLLMVWFVPPARDFLANLI